MKIIFVLYRQAAKLKEAKEKYEKAIKEGGVDLSDLKKQVEMIEKEKNKVVTEEEELKKREKVYQLNFI